MAKTFPSVTKTYFAFPLAHISTHSWSSMPSMLCLAPHMLSLIAPVHVWLAANPPEVSMVVNTAAERTFFMAILLVWVDGGKRIRATGELFAALVPDILQVADADGAGD